MLVPLELERPSGLTPPSTPFSPVSRVPPELLTKIFLYAVSCLPHQGLNATRTAPHTPSYRSCAGPFSISHVCRTWRFLSLSIPALWTNLRVTNPRTTKFVHLLSSWIGRTRQRPLNLSLHQYPCSSSPRTEQATKSVWRLFMSVMDKWRSLDVNVSMELPVDKLMAGVCRAKWVAPLNLETIKISFGSLNENPPAPHRGHCGYPGKRASEELTFFACVLHCSPRLRTAEWDNNHFYLQFGLISQLWGTLTDLTLTVSQDMVGLVFALSRCKSLQKLTIYNQTHVAHSDTNTSINHHDNTLFPFITSQCSPSYVDLPNLHTLTLGAFTHPELLFCHLFVPGIRTLQVLQGRYNKKGWRGLSNAAWASLQEMCWRCGARLAVLAVGGVEVDAAFDEPQWKGLARCTLKVADYHYSPLQKV